MLKKTAYLLIIFILSFILFNYLSTQSTQENQDTLSNASFLINKQSTDPKRLFLKTWRIVKSKYYDPTMNNQDWSRWNKRYVDRIKTQDDANVAIDTMIASLNDPYTQFLDKEEYKEQTTSIDAKITGIGVNIISLDGNVLIVSVVEDTPAEENGLKAGDIILSVNGKEVRGKTVSDVAALIRGKEGDSVKIELLQFIPGGIEDKPLLTASQVNRKIPINLPRSNPAATAILTAPTTPPPPLNTTPALAKAKSGSITKFTAPCKLSSRDCKGLIT